MAGRSPTKLTHLYITTLIYILFAFLYMEGLASSTRQKKSRSEAKFIQERLRQKLTKNETFGDYLIGRKEAGIYRHALQNPNGILSEGRYADMANYCQYMAEYKIDGLSLAETNLDWSFNNGQAKNCCNSHAIKFDNRSKLVTSHSEFDYNSVYKPGGTASLCQGPWAELVTEHGEDPTGEGKFSYYVIKGKGGNALMVITGYRVCEPGSKKEIKTAYKQQQALQRKRKIKQPNPRKQFFDDLKEFIKTRTDKDHHVMVALDANESFHTKSSGIAKFAREMNMVDAVSYKHGYDDEPNTYIRGSKKIDYLLVSTGLVDYIKKSGITPFGEGNELADHRMLHVDIDLQKALDIKPMDLRKLHERRIKSLESHQVPSYLREVNKYFEDHKIIQRIEELDEEILIEGLTPEMERRMNGIDEDISRACRHAENKLPKRYKIPWSPELKKAKKTLIYWKCWSAEIRTGVCKADARARAALAAGISPNPSRNPTLATINEEIKSARQMLNEVIRNATKLRKEHIEELICNAEFEGNHERAKGLRRLLAAENSSRAWARRNRLMGKIKTKSLQYLLKAKEWNEEGKPTAWSTITEPDKINAELLARNTAHFAQAQGTPFTDEKIVQAFYEDASSELVDKVLAGENDKTFEEYTEEMQQLLHCLKKDENIPVIDSTVSQAELERGYRKWREKTNTSKGSGLHLGHYRTWAKPSDEEDAEEIRQNIMAAHTKMVNLAIEHQMVYNRWKKVYSLMLEKIHGQPRLEKLRVIHLFEADLNLLIGILWGKRLVKQGQELDLFNEEQWGNLKGKQSRDAIFVKKMLYTLAHFQLKDMGSFDNDAKACYDRIVILLALMRSRQLGMPQGPCSFLAEFFKKAEYYVMTHYGVTDDWHACLDGSGQGARWSPAMWLIISTLLMDVMRNTVGTGAVFDHPITQEEIDILMTGFVDDTTIYKTILGLSTDEDAVPKMAQALQNAAQWWEKLLWQSGGKLELDKCFFYLMHWVFDEEGVPRLATKEELEVEIKIRDSETGKDIKIRQEDCRTAHRTLGAMECPALVYKAEAERIRKRCMEFANKMANKTLTDEDFDVLHNTFYLPRVGHTLPTTQLTEKQLADAQKPAIRAFLNLFHVNRHSPRAVVHAPIEYGGYGVSHLYAEQGAGQGMALLGHLRAGGTVERQMRAALDCLQMHAGVSFSLFDKPEYDLDYVLQNWFNSTLTYLNQSSIKMHIEGVYQVKPRRVHDRILMEDASVLGWTVAALKRINQCRMYLQAECLSDVSTADGTQITGYTRYTSKLKWPNLPDPGPKAWKTWHKFMLTYTKSDERSLNKPLGDWLDIGNQWDAVYEPETDSIAIEWHGKWKRYPVIKVTRNYIEKGPEGAQIDKPNKLNIPVTKDDYNPQRYSLPSNYSGEDEREKIRVGVSSFNEYKKQLPDWEQHLLENVVFHVHQDISLLEGLLDKNIKLLACSDGGRTDTEGYYGWVIGTDDKILCHGSGQAFGWPTSSFRSEAYGRLALLRFLTHVRDYYFGSDPYDFNKIESYCDNDGVLRNERKFDKLKWTPTAATRPDFDVINQLFEAWNECPITVPLHHVKGHQDDTKKFSELTRPEQLNVMADLYATEQRYAIQARGTHWDKSMALPSNPAYIYNGAGQISSKEKLILRTHWPRLEFGRYLCEKEGWDAETFNLIDWEVYKKARRGCTKAMNRFVTKMSTRWLPVNDRLHVIEGKDPGCPHCHEIESQRHFYQCNSRKQWKESFLLQLNAHLEKTHTYEELRLALVDGVRFELDNVPQEERPWGARHIHHKLTFHDLLCGRVTQLLVRQMDDHLRECAENKKLNGQLWAKKLIMFIWKHLHEVWKTRCQQQHDLDGTKRDKYRSEMAQKRIKMLYEYKYKVLAYDRNEIFTQDSQELCKKPVKVMEDWITTHEEWIRRAKRLADKQTKMGIKDIRSYFKSDWQPP